LDPDPRPRHAMSPFALPAALALATSSAEPVAREDLSVHASVAAGTGGVAFVGNGTAWSAGFAGEYWLTPNLGVGAQVTHQEMGTFPPCFDGCMAAAARTSVAASVALRLGDLASYPLLALAAGAAVGRTTDLRFACDTSQTPANAGSGCPTSGSGPYASFTAAWVFPVGEASSDGGGFTIGPLLRADVSAATQTLTSWNEVEWSTTAGVLIGLDLALPR
jgi:hypothetical protein